MVGTDLEWMAGELECYGAGMVGIGLVVGVFTGPGPFFFLPSIFTLFLVGVFCRWKYADIQIMD
jgi:hypothetical protein